MFQWIFTKRILLITAAKLLNPGSQVTESRQPNYSIAAAKLLKTAATWEAEARRTRDVANNLGTTSDSWERQAEAGASGVPQDLRKLGGYAR